MSKITYSDHLDDMMERLMDEDISPEQLQMEISRSKALCNIADKKIADKKIQFNMMIAVSSGKIDDRFIPAEFSEVKQISSNN